MCQSSRVQVVGSVASSHGASRRGANVVAVCRKSSPELDAASPHHIELVGCGIGPATSGVDANAVARPRSLLFAALLQNVAVAT